AYRTCRNSSRSLLLTCRRAEQHRHLGHDAADDVGARVEQHAAERSAEMDAAAGRALRREGSPGRAGGFQGRSAGGQAGEVTAHGAKLFASSLVVFAIIVR